LLIHLLPLLGIRDQTSDNLRTQAVTEVHVI